ncbi:hypothetical protein BH10ACI1_BH10ACI1_28040 [soil metagenome]
MIEPENSKLLVISNLPESSSQETGRRGGIASRMPNFTSVDVNSLQTQINVFLQQMNIVMTNTPEKVGDFKLSEFEISAAIVIQGKGQIGIALLGQAEISGQVSGGLKFVFKRETN